MIEIGPGTTAIMIVLAFVGLLACGVGALELRLWLRPWPYAHRHPGAQPTLLGGLLWLGVGGLILYALAFAWFQGIP